MGRKAAAVVQNLYYGVKEKKPIDTIFPSVKADKYDMPLN